MARIYTAIIIVSLLLSGCARGVFIGFGKHELEYYEDGALKRELAESKTPLENAVSISGINAK